MNKNTQLEEMKDELKALIALNRQQPHEFSVIASKIHDIVDHVLLFKFENQDSQILLEYISLISNLVIQIETMKNEVMDSLTKLNSNNKALGRYSEMMSMRNIGHE